jgi:hypothetical protein
MSLRSGGKFETKANPSIQELLDRAAIEMAPDKIDQRFPGQPEVQASILETLGRSYLGIGEYEKSAAPSWLRRNIQTLSRF